MNPNHSIDMPYSKPHNGSPITNIEVSPNGKYLVTHSEKDLSIVGWIVKDKEGKLNPDITVKIENHKFISQVCVSDDKKLVYIFHYREVNDKKFIDIIDMNNKENKIKLGLYPRSDYRYRPYCCTFNLKNDFILYSEGDSDFNNYDKKITWIYSTQTKNEWSCKGIYKIPDDFKLISISKYSKIYLFSNNYFYEWDIRTEKSTRIFANKNEKKEHQHQKNEKDEHHEKDEHREKNQHHQKKENHEKNKPPEKKEHHHHEKNKPPEKKEHHHHEKNKHYEHQKNEVEADDIKITSNEKFICLRIEDKTIIHSIELEIPIASLDINNGIQISNFVNYSTLYSLLPSLLDLFDYVPNNGIWNSVMRNCWKDCLDRLKKDDQLPKEGDKFKKFFETLPNNVQIKEYLEKDKTKYAFGILDGHVWKIKFEEKMYFSHQNELSELVIDWNHSDKLNNENDKIIGDAKGDKEMCEHLNLHVFSPYMDTIHKLFEDAITTAITGEKIELINTDNSIKWKAEISDDRIKLQVFKQVEHSDEWIQDPICAANTKIEKIEKYFHGIIASLLFKNDDIVILTTIGLYIFHFNEYDKSICLNYFYSMKLITPKDLKKNLRYYKKEFSKDTLPLPNNDSFKYDEWALYVKEDKESFLKYGAELLTFAIKELKLELIEEIYKKCIEYFKNDLENNRMFLSIITSTMPLLKKYCPEYILKYSSEATMIVDSPDYNVGRQTDSHLCSFSKNPQIIDLTHSIWWTKYHYLLRIIKENKILNIFIPILYFVQLLIIIPTLPLLFPIFYILTKYHFINYIYNEDWISKFYIYLHTCTFFDKIYTKYFEPKSMPTITFMVPYIKFVNYPHDYNDNWRSWFWDWIRPKPSPFIETVRSKEIYKTWNGEALINFKWDTYGRYYHNAAWIGFITLLICFIVATLPQQYIAEDLRRVFLIASIVLGIIQLSFEVRQFIYEPKRWWQLFDAMVYVLPIVTSSVLLGKKGIFSENDWIVQLISYSCLFLDLKVLLFFRVFKSYARYFAIIISVAQKVYFFLVVFLAIIMMSFAHAFFIILSPKLPYSLDEYDPKNNDINYPWKLTTTYQVFQNGAKTGTTVIQQPDENTNMFTEYRTALFAMISFLSGDKSALSDWPYEHNPSLVILTVLFTFLTVIYLLNVFIGLFTDVIKDDTLEASQLILKAEILAKIELFYLFPNQRRWRKWFPEVIHYYANVDEIREKVQKMIRKGKWNNNSEFSDMKKGLLKILNIQNDSDALQKLEQIQNKIEKIDKQLFGKPTIQNNSDDMTVLQLLEQIREIQLREMQKKDK